MELYSSSFFATSLKSRFITCLAAVEAIINQSSSSTELLEWIEELSGLTKKTKLSTDDCDQVVNALNRQKTKSITRSGVELANSLLPSTTYGQKTAGQFFKWLYTIRGEIVHDGTYRSVSDEEFKQLFRDCKKFVGDLFVARASANVSNNPR